MNDKIPSFNAKKCLRALKRLGFLIDKTKGKGGHVKAYFPSYVKITRGQRPFIIIPLHGKFRLQKVVLKELKEKGIFSRQFVNALKK